MKKSEQVQSTSLMPVQVAPVPRPALAASAATAGGGVEQSGYHSGDDWNMNVRANTSSPQSGYGYGGNSSGPHESVHAQQRR